MFKDKFCKWPKLLRVFVILSLLPPAFVFILVQQQLAPSLALNDVLLMVGGFNVVLILWGVLLKIRSRKYWYRNYHIGKTLMLALIPILASCYVSFSEMPESQVVKQEQVRSVEIAIN
ncbi:hypothetical protein A3K86_01860 [Photobacterium jeanii]|uniref:Uncharacterized protein n=1 Tax=Photobacterium jeanii TaxID=858640 RepID=A0A178KQD0_9GAMM|nr:hypothetical protein A3K86_01860 [Photobacterium jeanii]PST92828.1 hypothetical protein C9I91_05625 [Photobacterium jeanii]